MMEASSIIRVNIRHYQELLKLSGLSEKQRLTVVKSLSEAQAELPFAMAEERRMRRNCQRPFQATL
jgi:hypothetical protein